MKFLTFKRVTALVLVLAIGIIAGIYFFAGVKAFTIDYDNVKFDETGFIDFQSSGGVAGTNYKFYRETENGEEEVVFNKNKKIDENEKYFMYLDEETTIFTIVDKTTSAVVYSSALDQTLNDPNAKNDRTAANLSVRYARKSDGKFMDTIMDTYRYSVAFENSLTGELEKHYKIKYLEDAQGNIDGVQILYAIGKFSANRDYFPPIFEKMVYNSEDENVNLRNEYSLEAILGGNTIFTDTTQTFQGGDTGEYRVKTFNGRGVTYSKEAALYIEENGLATVTEGNNQWALTDISPELLNGFGTHINVEGSPITMNPFIPRRITTAIQDYYKPVQYKQNSEAQTPDDLRETWKLPSSAGSTILSDLYKYLYTVSDEQYTSGSKVHYFLDENGERVQIGGYHAKDEDGNYLYDEEGKPVRELFTLDKVAQINEHFGIESQTSLERFQVGLQVKLDNTGILATVMAETLRDSDHKKLDIVYDHDFIMRSIEVLPGLTTTRDVTADGMMVIPDGSGAIINFNNKKAEQNYSPYTSNVYGADLGFVTKVRPEETKNLMFGMYGFLDVTNKRGLMTVAEKGAAQSTLFADTPRGTNLTNYIYYMATVRQNESVVAGTGWNESSFMKWAQQLIPTDIEYRYVFLYEDELDYVSLANKYREYLINRFNLEEKDTTTSNVVDLNFLGAFERYALFLGIKYMKDDSLTTFSEAIEIIEELKGNNVSNLNVGYRSWTSKEFEYETTARLKVSKALGGTKGLKKLSEYLEDNGMGFYPEMFVTSSKGYDYSFGNIKYTAKSVGNFYSRQYPYNLATLMEDKSLNPTYYLNPKFYRPIAENLFDSYGRFNLNGAFLTDLGNYRLGSYNKNNEIYPLVGEMYQIDAMNYIQNEVGNVKLSAPFDYAFPYVQTAVDIPLTSSTYGILDATIPFYQLVISGLFDYTTETVNGTSDKSTGWYLAKALETGSNLQFLVSYTDPEVLLDTDYTQYYKSYYDNWKETIIEMNDVINQVNIHAGRLVGHETIAKDVAKVTYSHGLTIIVNSSNITYNYLGTDIPSYGYKVL